jgi:hypothetical protein
MTALRLISLPTHAALEMAGGFVLMAAPFLLGFSAAGLVVSVVLGALIVGLALSAVPVEGRTVPISAHFAYDRGIAVGLLGGALVLGLAGDVAASAVLAAVALAQALLNVTTRYSARA